MYNHYTDAQKSRLLYGNMHAQTNIYGFSSICRLLWILTLLLCLAPGLLAQTLELRGSQPDYPMLRNGVPLLVDGQSVRIAGSEFRFLIDTAGPDSLTRYVTDGRVFNATGTCEGDLSGGFLCRFTDTAGNVSSYSLEPIPIATGLRTYTCVGRTTEPKFVVRASLN